MALSPWLLFHVLPQNSIPCQNKFGYCRYKQFPNFSASQFLFHTRVLWISKQGSYSRSFPIISEPLLECVPQIQTNICRQIIICQNLNFIKGSSNRLGVGIAASLTIFSTCYSTKHMNFGKLVSPCLIFIWVIKRLLI